jgi:hypothetical protein
MQTLELYVGQSVPWAAAPGGVAQVAELLRTRVRLFYPTKRGRPRGVTVRVAALALAMERQPLLIEQRNPFRRGIVRVRRKTFHLEGGADAGCDRSAGRA